MRRAPIMTEIGLSLLAVTAAAQTDSAHTGTPPARPIIGRSVVATRYGISSVEPTTRVNGRRADARARWECRRCRHCGQRHARTRRADDERNRW